MSVHRVLFEDTFTIKSVDNTKFDRVSRIESKSQAFETTLTLDINTDIYPLVAEQVRYYFYSSYHIDDQIDYH